MEASSQGNEANLFLHYAFDGWMRRNHPDIPFERYADDGICHCQSEEQARKLRAALEQRFAECGLTLHPEKTHVVYCKDDDRRGDYPNQKFDFLGYTFRPRLSRPEGVAEEVELLVGVVSAPVIILAVDDVRLLGMKRQATFGEPPLKRCAQHLCLRFAPTVTDRIIGITLEWDVRIVPPHPPVERIVEKKIRQEGADDPALRRASFPADQATIRHLNGRTQPPFEVEQHPGAVRMLAHRPHQQSPVDLIEKGFDVQIEHPGVAPTALPRHADGVERRLPGPISIRVVVEMGFHKRLQISLDHHLGDAVGDRGNPQRPCPPIVLRYLHPSHRRRKVTTGRQPIPQLVEVVREISLEICDRLSVYASRTLVGSDSLVGFPYFPFRNVERLCSIHGVPPVAG